MPPLVVRAVGSARKDLLRALDGFDDASGAFRVGGLNEVAWMVAHLADQEQRFWSASFERTSPRPEVAGYRGARPDTVMPLSQALAAWREVTAASDEVLDDLTEADLARTVPDGRHGPPETIGVRCLRVFGHYYLHIGQITAVRRMLGMPVPTFVGALPVMD
jgi:uncharacterized damage-inducible protein DinB